MKKILLLSLACLLTLCVTSCKKKNIQQDATFQSAERAMADGQYDMARIAYTECLDKAPTESIVHRRLADLYYDHLDRMEYAIYHYEQSVRFNPQQEEAVNMQHWITGARKKLMKDLINLYMPQEIDAKRRMEEKMATLENDNAQMKRRLDLFSRVRTVPAAPQETSFITRTVTPTPPRENPPTVPVIESPTIAETTITPPEQRALAPPVATPPPRETAPLRRPVVVTPVPTQVTAARSDKYHTVTRGETLSSIATRYYKDKRKYTLIVSANPTKIKNLRSPLKVGMVLKIPNASTQ